MATAAYLDAISGARNGDESCPECGATPEQSHAIGCPNDEREG